MRSYKVKKTTPSTHEPCSLDVLPVFSLHHGPSLCRHFNTLCVTSGLHFSTRITAVWVCVCVCLLIYEKIPFMGLGNGLFFIKNIFVADLFLLCLNYTRGKNCDKSTMCLFDLYTFRWSVLATEIGWDFFCLVLFFVISTFIWSSLPPPLPYRFFFQVLPFIDMFLPSFSSEEGLYQFALMVHDVYLLLTICERRKCWPTFTNQSINRPMAIIQQLCVQCSGW